MNVADILNECGLGIYVQALEDEEITLESLLIMNDDTLKTVIVKAGPRAILLRKIAELNAKKGVDGSVEKQGTSVADDEAHSFSASAMYLLPPASPSVSDISLSVPPSPAISSASSGRSVPSSADGKLKSEILKLLENHALGDIVLKTTGTTLDMSKRMILVDILANDLIVKFERPLRENYEHYCNMILSLFPMEYKETYYVPSVNSLNPRGKLYSKVCNLINKKRAAGCIVKKQRIVETAVQWDLNCSVQEDKEVVQEAISWLKLYQQPESKLVDYWKKTFHARMSFISSTDKQVTLPMILDEWPRYKDNRGHVLIAEDFTAMFPESSENMCKLWPDISAKIVQQLRRIKDKQSSNLVSQLLGVDESNQTDSNSASTMTATLALLPLLLPEPAIATLSKGKGRKRAYFKPSIVESMAWFIDIQKPGLDLNDHLTAKSTELERRNAGRLQPHVLVLTADNTLREDCLIYAVIQGGHYYKVESVPAAIDTCLKASFVFNLKYPSPANSSWIFLQRAVYKIETADDCCGNRVMELLTSIQQSRA